MELKTKVFSNLLRGNTGRTGTNSGTQTRTDGREAADRGASPLLSRVRTRIAAMRPLRSRAPDGVQSTTPVRPPRPPLSLMPVRDVTVQSRPLDRGVFQEKLEAVRPWADRAELIRDTKRHVTRQLHAAYAGKPEGEWVPVLLVLSGAPSSPACMMVQVAALAAIREAGRGTPTLLVQQPDLSVSRTVKGELGRMRELVRNASDAEVSALIAGPRLMREAGVLSHTAMAKGTLLVASRLGFAIGGAYPGGEKPKTDFDCEAAMADGIHVSLMNSEGPVVVIVGRHHVPTLINRFDEFNGFALATADHGLGDGDDPGRYARHSALLTHAAIKPYRAAKALTDGPVTDFMKFCGEAGAPLR